MYFKGFWENNIEASFEYIEKTFSPLLCAYRKDFNTQTGLIGLVEKWFDKKGYAGAILMDLSKACDTINYEKN